jgi:F-type H+-transporting ATPase subunit a
MVYEFIGEEEGKRYVPFITSLFLFILACNLIGLIPGSYTITSQLAVTAAFAVGIFFLTLVIGFGKHGMHFLGILVPPGVPKIMIPLMVPIEIISMLARPISLAVRLFANMTAGHTVLAVLFGLAMTGPLWLGWLPFGFTIVINGLEIAIAFIQAYIFTTLTCVYIGDVIKLH